jgi:group II intron reverse transcriptase/maturase/CRISPR-associated endonuclease Cas1/CRISPR-associated endoribonuclease Cas6
MEPDFYNKIPVRTFNLRLSIKKPLTFHFYHGTKLNGFISRVLQWHPTEEDQKITNDIVVYPCESGRISYVPGDEYCFSISFLKDDQSLIEKFKANIQNIPESDFPGDMTNDTVEFISLKEMENRPGALQAPADNIYTINFVTPLRIERRKEERSSGKRYFDVEYFDCAHFFNLLYKRTAALYELNFGKTPDCEMPEMPAIEILEKQFIWIDAPKDTKPIGGMMGMIKIKAELNNTWKSILSFGQIMHAGKNSSFGFGKYFIDGSNAEELSIKPAKTHLDFILEKKNLDAAFLHISENIAAPGISEELDDRFAEKNENDFENLSDEIAKGMYNPSDLKGVILPKEGNKIRALAIPVFKDRVLQRAVVQILGESIEHLLEENSFAYRKGFSRLNAARAINDAHKNGFRFILESDIQSFFDNVDWHILNKKLEILFRNDPILAILKKWIECDVIFNGTRIKRSKGLPQGAAVSPMLANLYLDEFDESLQNDFKLIRYADDFVILCKSKEQAEEALIKVKESLKNLDLEIKPSKTHIISFEEGFQYLGYLFVNSMIVEKKKEEKPENLDGIIIDKEIIPAGSWLTHIDIEKIRPLKRATPESIKPLTQSDTLDITDEKYPLYITRDTLISIDKDKIEIEYEIENERKTENIPFGNINSVIIEGYSKITMPAVFKLNDNEIPIYFCRPSGQIRLAIPSAIPDFELWNLQAQLSNDADFVLQFAREVVCSKINNHKVIVRRNNENMENGDEFDRLIDKAGNAESLASLRGIEGTSAVLYFDYLRESLPAVWNFDARTKHPPEDPVNAMLSFGYSILYNHISTALQVEGMNPQIGFYHQTNPRYFPLASDLQEEFRHIIDSLTLYIVRRNMVSVSDFIIEEDNKYPCLMTNDFRRKFIQMVEERLNVLFTPFNATKQITYRKFIHRQVKALKKGIKNRTMEYKPLRIR